MALGRKHQEFVNQYLVDFNGTRAAQRAGYAGNDNVLAVTAHDLLRNPKISEAIDARLRESAMRADEVLMRLAVHARGDINDFLGEDGCFNLEKARTAKKTSLIKKLKTKTTTRTFNDIDVVTTEIEFELYDAQAANRLIGEHYALFKGSQESPQHVVTHTQAEWEAAQAKRHAEAAQAFADFADDDAAEPATDE